MFDHDLKTRKAFPVGLSSTSVSPDSINLFHAP